MRFLKLKLARANWEVAKQDDIKARITEVVCSRLFPDDSERSTETDQVCRVIDLLNSKGDR